MYTRRSPLPDQGESSSGSSTSAASSSSSDPRSPSKPSKNRPQRPELSTPLPMETIQSFNAAYNAGPVYISEGLGSPVHGRGSPNSSSSGKSNSPTHSRSSSLGSTHGMSNSSPQAQAAMQAAVMAGQHHDDIRHGGGNRDMVHMDIHSQIREYQRENESLRQELDNRETKLNSSMNSIKTFWSPELKKERALRKEEAAKIQSLKEQCRVAVEENQQFLRTIRELKEQLQHREHNLRHSPNGDVPNGGSAQGTLAHLQHEVDGLRTERDRVSREVFLLRKTLEEMELRIETQKQTLTARDESIKKLLEMLQSKGLNTKKLEGDQEEMDRMRSKVVEAEARVIKLQKLMEQRDMEENRDGNVGSRSNGTVGQTDDSSTRLKIKLDQLKGKLSLKVAELQALQTKFEAMKHKERDQQAHINLLKESLAAKEQHSSILQADVDALRFRLEDKEHQLSKQEVVMTSINTDKSKQSSEAEELREMNELKERRIVALQRKHADLSKGMELQASKLKILQVKNESLQEQLKERDSQAVSLRDRLTTLQADQSSSDSAVSSLEDALIDKDRTIEKLRAEKEQEIKDKEEAIGRLAKQIEELKMQVGELQKSVSEKEASFLDLKEHASTVASGALKKDSRITTLEIQLAQKTEELIQAESELKKLKDERDSSYTQEIQELQGSVSAMKEEVRKSHAEVDRLLEIMKEMEGEKNDKEKRIKDLESVMRKHCPGQLKDVNKKLVAVKRDQQTQKRKNAQLLEDYRRREGEMSSDTHQLQDMVKEKEDRVEELAEALKESVTITADREMLIAQQTEAISKLKKQLEDVRRELDDVRKQLSMASNKLSTTQVLLKEKEAKLKAVQAEGRKHLEEALGMKQEALTAAIGEKDAHIALLELNRKGPKSSEELKLLKKEKDTLVQQLKDEAHWQLEVFLGRRVQHDPRETQKRMKLLHNHTDGDKSPLMEHSPITPEQCFSDQFHGGVHSVTL
ncbi:ELKS/Rab6-interacting/CAST family member 1-like isoform X3 [Lytechinus variegatus]|uniref:ELKS/Rab6-interacting/CAST family member 1-like isoform X3 n=1 Tax=Lytechinus variegatus TaxID=7654 RepID=UPI001BB2C210|nr:ELKS/Rab6-interacting/CAST family member 1-like isoform X3 [Lytechinus variegatus]